jgi:hypothetical protein
VRRTAAAGPGWAAMPPLSAGDYAGIGGAVGRRYGAVLRPGVAGVEVVAASPNYRAGAGSSLLHRGRFDKLLPPPSPTSLARGTLP